MFKVCFLKIAAFFYLSAGMKFRTSKSDTNGSVKSPETNQVSSSRVPVHIVEWLWLWNLLYAAVWKSAATKVACSSADGSISFFFIRFCYFSRMKIWNGWKIIFPALSLMCKHLKKKNKIKTRTPSSSKGFCSLWCMCDTNRVSPVFRLSWQSSTSAARLRWGMHAICEACRTN